MDFGSFLYWGLIDGSDEKREYKRRKKGWVSGIDIYRYREFKRAGFGKGEIDFKRKFRNAVISGENHQMGI
jgi:hypothetical protein